MHLNWIRLATNPSWLDSSIGRAAVHKKPEDASSNRARVNEFLVVVNLQCQINMNLVFHISEDGSEIELKHCASSKSKDKR